MSLKRKKIFLCYFLVLLMFFNSGFSHANNQFIENKYNIDVFKGIMLDEDMINKNKKIDDSIQDLTEKVVIETLSQLSIDSKLIDGLNVYISPYSKRNATGFAYGYSKKIELSHPGGIGPYWNKYYAIQSVFLHELGHVMHSQIEKHYNEDILDEYAVIYDEFKNGYNKDYDAYNWGNLIEESFAEDFRIYVETNFLGSKSYYKRTNQEYKEEDIIKFFNKYLYKENHISKEEFYE